MSRQPVRAGFIPLLDCAPLIAAVRAGFTEAEGIDVELIRETSWASLRDRIAVRQLDAAHMLAPMPIASALGLTPLPAALIAPIALGSGGNTITVAPALWSALAANGAPADFEPRGSAAAFAAVVRRRQGAGAPPPVMAIVHPYSAHHYQLAYWLAAAGLDPKTDVEITVVPPPLMPDALSGGQIDGFCVGEPWGSMAAASGTGHILTTSAHIWRSSPEKVLGVRQSWADGEPDRLAGLVRAVHRAAAWCDDAANRERLASLLAAPDILNRPAAEIARSLERLLPGPLGTLIPVDGFLSFSAGRATWPGLGHAAWYYAQMVRWGQVQRSSANLARACASYRPDIYRDIVGGPAVNEALGPDGFFDGETFDAGDVDGYLARVPRPTGGSR